LNTSLSNEVPISKEVIKGSFWILALRITNRILGLARTVILARLLLPEHFGLVGIAAITVSILETFSQHGLGVALVQKKENIRDYLDTAWTASIIRCLLIYLILLFSAPYVTQFFKAPEATIVIQVFGISVIMAGFRNIAVLYFQRELDFKKQYLYEFSILLGNISVAIPAALLLRNVWALVLGGIAGSITRFIMSYVLHPYRPRLRFELEKFLNLFGFGKWVLGSSILVFLITQGDDIFLGKILGVTALGFYQMAFMIANLPTTEISQVVSHVTFPAYSKIQEDTQRFANAYLKVMQMITFIAVPLAGAIFTFTPDLISLLFSNKWMPVVPIVRILVWAGLLKALIDTTSSVFNAVGKPEIITKWQIVNFIVLGLSIYPLAKLWGIVGISSAVLMSNAVTTIICIHESKKLLRYEGTRLFKIIIFPLSGISVSISIIIWLKNIWGYDNILELVLLFSAGSFVYLVITWFFDKVSNYNMRLIIKESIIGMRMIRS